MTTRIPFAETCEVVPARSENNEPASASGLFIGCAGWTLSAAVKARFPPDGSHLERYARRLQAVEINSSFYREHRRSTYSRWSNSVPAAFRFSVKIPKRITHEMRLTAAVLPLQEFLDQVAGLDEKLGCLLIQLPPSLRFSPRTADDFLRSFRNLTQAPAVIEPRHISWFSKAVSDLLRDHRVGRVAADPPPDPAAVEPAGWQGCIYFRLHGSPRMYYSAYSQEHLSELASRIRAAVSGEQACWCIFDNTAEGAAWHNALDLNAFQTNSPRAAT
jgi:uncharacterized protein YecE (DUF72 family)